VAQRLAEAHAIGQAAVRALAAADADADADSPPARAAPAASANLGGGGGGCGVEEGLPLRALQLVDEFATALAVAETLLARSHACLWHFPGRLYLADGLATSGVTLGRAQSHQRATGRGGGGRAEKEWGPGGGCPLEGSDRAAVFDFLDADHRRRHDASPAANPAAAVSDAGATSSQPHDHHPDMRDEPMLAAGVSASSVVGVGVSMPPTSREYVLRSADSTCRMGCAIHEADTFPLTRSVRIAFSSAEPHAAT
jgi:hypothetical protein